MKILKIIGIIIGSFAGMFILVFFAYPYINKDKFDEMIRSEQAPLTATIGSEISTEELQKLKEELERMQSENRELMAAFDSLNLVKEDLELELEEWEKMEEFMPVPGSPTEPVQRGSTYYMDDEEFAERVKSLLNLDEEELAPIIREMDQGQLVRLYQNAGTIQREKLLRSLEPKRAAALMKEVMS